MIIIIIILQLNADVKKINNQANISIKTLITCYFNLLLLFKYCTKISNYVPTMK